MSRVELDCRGLRCPLPVIKLAALAATTPPGSQIAVAATDVAARYDIPAWCRMRNHEFVGEEIAPDDVPVYLVRVCAP